MLSHVRVSPVITAFHKAFGGMARSVAAHSVAPQEPHLSASGAFSEPQYLHLTLAMALFWSFSTCLLPDLRIRYPMSTRNTLMPANMLAPAQRPRKIGTSVMKNIMNDSAKQIIACPLGSGSGTAGFFSSAGTLFGGGTSFPQLRQNLDTSGISAPQAWHFKVSPWWTTALCSKMGSQAAIRADNLVQ